MAAPDRRPAAFPFARVEPGTILIDVADIPDPGAASVVIGEGLMRADVVICRHDGEVRAYHNACPHGGTPLETFDGRFLDNDNPQILVCSTHGARFRAEDGYCIKGPCMGLALRRIPVRIEAGRVVAA
ncbi:MAG: Rieske 2Fe-2S domain-containing protein [Hyphomicrobiales bacterium]|nr:Rieske 2Fe-2S domain-containing protein [Hyphomicrobiales bacterium]